MRGRLGSGMLKATWSALLRRYLYRLCIIEFKSLVDVEVYEVCMIHEDASAARA
jgi:hypothetical protein